MLDLRKRIDQREKELRDSFDRQAAERHCDLMRQGLAKLSYRKPHQSKPKTAPVVRSCDHCRDWHSGSCASFQKKKAARNG
jgi:hypothetical protein